MKNNKPKQNKTKSSAGFWFRALGAIAIGVCVGILILFWYTPRAYKPIRPANPEEVSHYLTHELGPEFYDQVQRNEPFELTISQSGLNDIISRWNWPQQIGEATFSDPYIIFSQQSVILMGTLKYKKVSSVISITALPAMDSDGKISLNIRSVRFGMVPATTLLTTLVQKAFDDTPNHFAEDPEAREKIQSLIRGEPIDPRFRISEHRVQVTDFSIETGFLKLTLLPQGT